MDVMLQIQQLFSQLPQVTAYIFNRQKNHILQPYLTKFRTPCLSTSWNVFFTCLQKGKIYLNCLQRVEVCKSIQTSSSQIHVTHYRISGWGNTTLQKYKSRFIFNKNYQTVDTLFFQSLAVSLSNNRLNIKKFYVSFALRCVFCTDLRTNSDFYFIQH
jgi:hypothetical protein